MLTTIALMLKASWLGRLLGAVLSFIRDNRWAQLLLLLACVALALWFVNNRAYSAGYTKRGLELVEYRKRLDRMSAEKLALSQKEVDDLKVKLAEAQKTIIHNTRSNQSKVAILPAPVCNPKTNIVYRDRVTGSTVKEEIELPLGYLNLYNAAIANRSATETEVKADSPSGVGLRSLMASTIGNFGVCHGWKQEAITWRDWYSRMDKIYDGKPVEETTKKDK